LAPIMKHVVSVADMKTSMNKEDVFITYALGSCLGITIYDPIACIGGMLHAMLPQSSIDPQKAAVNPHMFVDTGFSKLFYECQKLGGRKERLVIKVAGGASPLGMGEDDYFKIGQRNIVMLRKLLWKNGMLIAAHDVGGSCSRTMTLEIASGDVSLKIGSDIRKL
jgi:chemotaxis protein CheD